MTKAFKNLSQDLILFSIFLSEALSYNGFKGTGGIYITIINHCFLRIFLDIIMIKSSLTIQNRYISFLLYIRMDLFEQDRIYTFFLKKDLSNQNVLLFFQGYIKRIKFNYIYNAREIVTTSCVDNSDESGPKHSISIISSFCFWNS